MRLKELADVHAARHAERIQDDVNWGAVWEVRHVLNREDARDDALIAVSAGHLVAHGDLSLLGNGDAHQLVHTSGEVGIFAEELAYLHYSAALAVRESQR